MTHSKDIVPRDEDGKRHGYIEKYYEHGGLFWKGVMFHGIAYGYCTGSGVHRYVSSYYSDDVMISADNAEGYCYIWDKDIVDE